MTFSEFLNMGGYGFYIWTSYILTAVLCIALYLSARVRRKTLLQQISMQSVPSQTTNTK